MRLLVLLLLGASTGIWWYRRWDGRRRLSQLERGERCMSCEGLSVTRDGGVVRCETCGHETPLSSLTSAGRVSDEEIKELTRADGRGILP